MSLVQQIEGEVVVIVDDSVATLLAIVILYLGEGIEGTVRHIELEAGDFLQQTHDEVAAALKGDTHLLDAFLGAVIGGLGSLLGNRGNAAGVLTLHLVDSLGYPQRSGNVTNAITGHGVSLGNTIDNNHLLLDGAKLGERLVLAHIVDVLVDFIGNDHHVGVTLEHGSDGL